MNPFEALGLCEETLKALNDLGFQEPTPVQAQTIPLALSTERDLTVLAQTGTGKTAAFGLPLLELIEIKNKQVQGLILAPTRELCVQISRDLQAFSKYAKGMRITAVYGGANIRTQIADIRKGTQVIVATPGRLIDLIERGAVRLEHVTNVVLDEADEMLNMGFQEDLSTILKETPEHKKTWLFSATMSAPVKRIAKSYMNEWEDVVIGRENSAASQLAHKYCVVHGKDKHPALRRFIDVDPDLFAIVFCRTKLGAQRLAERLIKEGYDADSLHGDLSQDQRDKVMGRYRQRSLQLLIATDVAARGIDVNEVTHVFHYDLPNDLESYTHRSGRTGRAGKKGVSLSILGKGDVRKIQRFQNELKVEFTHIPVPTGPEICEMQLMALIQKIKNVKVNTKEIARFMPAIQEALGELEPMELMERLVAIEFTRFIDQYRNAKDLNASVDKSSRSRDGGGRDDSNMRSLRINLGRYDDMEPGRMLAHLCNASGVDGDSFGRIKLNDAYSVVDIQAEHFEDVLNAINGTDYHGRQIEASETQERGSDRGGRGGFRGGSRNRAGGRPHKRSAGRSSGRKNSGGRRPFSDERSSSDRRSSGKRFSKTGSKGRSSEPFKRNSSTSSAESGEGGKKKRSFKGVGGKKKVGKKSSATAKAKGKRNKYKNLKK